MSPLWIAVLARVLSGAQESEEAISVTIPRAEKSTYAPILNKYKEAEAALAGDPLDCALRCTGLINAVRTEYCEKRWRIENQDSSYGRWTLFLPYQLRGLANLARAEALAGRDRAQAAELARDASKDFEVSKSKGVKSSGPLFERARRLVDQLAEVKPEPDPRAVEAKARIDELRVLKNKATPDVLLRRCAECAAVLERSDHKEAFQDIRTAALEAGWRAHADQKRFRSASNFLRTHGGFLAKAGQGAADSTIDKLCAEYIGTVASGFRNTLRETLLPGQSWDALKALTAEKFDALFALPDPAEIVATDAELEKVRRSRDRLVAARAVADPLALPLPEFLKFLSGVTQTSETAAIGFDLSIARLAKAVEGAADLSAAELGLRREEVERVLAAAAGFAGGAEIGPQRQAIERFKFPLADDPPDIDEIGKELLDPANAKGLWGNSPRLAGELEERLALLVDGKFSREARQKIGTYLLAAVSARLLLSGKTVDDIVKGDELRAAARLLGASGGPLPEVMAKVSPKIRAVADGLKR